MKSFTELIKYEIISFKWDKSALRVLINSFLKQKLKSEKNSKGKYSITLAIKDLSKKINTILTNSFSIKTKLTDMKIISDDEKLFQLKEEIIPLENDLDRSAFIAGIFLASGSCNSPFKTTYNLELRVKKMSDAINLYEVMSLLGIKTRERTKGGWNFLYIKSPFSISDFLKSIKATESMFIFEQEKINKDFQSSIKKLENFEKLNLSKTKDASEKYIKKINELVKNKKIDEMKIEIKNLFMLRSKYPNYTLDDLTNSYNKKYKKSVSKSTINHWLRTLL